MDNLDAIVDEVFVPQPIGLTVSKNPTIITEQILPRHEDPNIFATPVIEDENLPDIPDTVPQPVTSRGAPRGRRGRGRPGVRGRGRGRRGAPPAPSAPADARPRRLRGNYAPVVEVVQRNPDNAAGPSLALDMAPGQDQDPESPASPEIFRLDDLFDGFDLKLKPTVNCQIIGISEIDRDTNEYTLKLSDHRNWVWSKLSSTHTIHIK